MRPGTLAAGVQITARSGVPRQGLDVGKGGLARHGGLAVIHHPQRAFEARALEVAQHHAAQVVDTVGYTDHGHRRRGEQGFEIANTHDNPFDTAGG